MPSGHVGQPLEQGCTVPTRGAPQQSQQRTPWEGAGEDGDPGQGMGSAEGTQQ